MWVRNQDTSLWSPNVDTLSSSSFDLLKQDLKSLRFYQKVLSGALFSELHDQGNIYDVLTKKTSKSIAYTNAFSPYVKPYAGQINDGSYITSESTLYDYLNKHISEYGQTLKTLFTPKRLISDQIRNLHYVDVATTEQIDNLNATFPVLQIDGIRIKNGHRILVKDQVSQVILPQNTDPDDFFNSFYFTTQPLNVGIDTFYNIYNSQNGIYEYQNGLLLRTTDLDNYESLINFTACVKLGDVNRERQFVLQRLDNGYFPEYTKGESIYFSQSKNYVLRNRMDYNNLYELVLNDTLKHGQQNVIANNVTHNIPERAISVGEFGTIIVHQEDYSNFINNKYKSTLRSISQNDNYYFVCGDDGLLIKLSKIDFTILKISLQETLTIIDREGFTQQETTKVETTLNSVSFANNLRGVVVGKFNQIWLTTDGGLKWSRIYVADFDAFNFNSAIFLDSDTFYVGGDNGVFVEFSFSNDAWTAYRRRISQYRSLTEEYLLVDDIRDMDYFVDNSGYFTGTASFIAIGAENGYLFLYDLDGSINAERDVQYDFYYVGGSSTYSTSCSLCQYVYSWVDNKFGDIQSVSYQESNSKLLFSTFDTIYQVSPFTGAYSSTTSNILAVDTPVYYTQSGVNAIYSYQEESIITGINSMWKSIIENVISSTYSPDVYAILDATSLSYLEANDAATGVENWFKEFCESNPSYTGTLYVLPSFAYRTGSLAPIISERWLDIPRQILSLDPTGNGNFVVQRLGTLTSFVPFKMSYTQSLVSERTNGKLLQNTFLGNPQPTYQLTFATWSRPTDMILLAFFNESEDSSGFGYHGSAPQVWQGHSTTYYQTDYNDFTQIVSPLTGNSATKLNSFLGVLYPVIAGTGSPNINGILNGGAAALAIQGISALYGSTLSVAEIEAIPGLSTDTTFGYPGESFGSITNNDTSGWNEGWDGINAQILTTYNPYISITDPNGNPGLTQHGWKVVVDKRGYDSLTGDVNQIFEPFAFTNDLNEILDLTSFSLSASNVYHESFFNDLKPRLLFMDYDAGSKLYWFDDYGQYRLPERIFLPVSYLVDSTASTQSFIQFKENSNEIIDGNTGITSSYFETNWITYWKDRMKSFEYHTHLDDAYKVEPSFTFESSNYLSGIFTYTASNITTNLSNFQNLVPITSEKVSRFRDTSATITAPVASYNLYFYKFLGIWAVTIPVGQVAPKKGDVIEIECGIFKGRFIINKIFSEIDGVEITYYQYFYTDFNENILNNLNGFSGSMKVKNLNKYATTKGGIKDFTTSYDTSGYSSGIFRKVPGDNRSSFDINVNSAGEITSITLIDPGFGFNVGSTFNIASGGVFGGIVDITVSVTELDYNSEFLQNFKSHYISYAYDIEVVDEYIPLPEQSPIGVTQSFQITGKYNQFSAYYNLQANIEILTTQNSLVEIDMRYQTSFLNFGYSPTYNLLSYLNFIDNKKYLPNKEFTALPCYENIPGPDSGVPDTVVINDNIVYMDFLVGEYSLTLETNKLIFGQNLKPLFDSLMKWTFVDLILREGPWPNITGAQEYRTNRLLIIDKIENTENYTIVFHDKFTGNNNITSVTILSRRSLQQISDDLQYINNIQRPKWKEISIEQGYSYTNYESDIGYKISTDSYTKVLLSDSGILEDLSAIVYTDYKFELAIQIVKLEEEFNIVPSNVSNSQNSKYLISLPKKHKLKMGEGVVVQYTATQSFNPQVLGYRAAKVIDDYNFEIEVPYTGFLPIDPLNIYYVKKDPFLNFQPCDIFDLGVGDKLPKQSIEITPDNYDLETNVYFLKNINPNKFRYKLIDGLDLMKLSQDFYWVLDAEVTDAIIGLDSSNNLVWYKGTWEGGRWFGGTWISGNWKSGDWYDGVWTSKAISDRQLSVRFDQNLTNQTSSKWFGGRWFGGTWNDGTWYTGRWYGGTWKNGRWFDGTWNDGTWEKGKFTGGIWVRGTWRNGIFNTDSRRAFWLDGTWFSGDFENGIWYNGIFNSTPNQPMSRFGVKSFNTRHSIWHGGNFIMGEFHSFLNLGDNGLPTVSLNHKNSTWYTGKFRGYFYGGNAHSIDINSSIWYGGVVSDIPIKRINTTTNSFTLDGIYRFNLNDKIRVIDNLDSLYSSFGSLNSPGTYQILDTTIDETTNKTELVVDKLLSNIYGSSLDTGTINTKLKIVSNFENVSWNSGVWNNGIFSAGRFLGGIWYNGVFSGIWG